jgi:hypothetical protein
MRRKGMVAIGRNVGAPILYVGREEIGAKLLYYM